MKLIFIFDSLSKRYEIELFLKGLQIETFTTPYIFVILGINFQAMSKTITFDMSG